MAAAASRSACLAVGTGMPAMRSLVAARRYSSWTTATTTARAPGSEGGKDPTSAPIPYRTVSEFIADALYGPTGAMGGDQVSGGGGGVAWERGRDGARRRERQSPTDMVMGRGKAGYFNDQGIGHRSTATGGGGVSPSGSGRQDGNGLIFSPDPIDFPSLADQREYVEAVSDLYRTTGAAWSTPGELFQPHYYEAYARFLVDDFRSRGLADAAAPFHVVEAGAGNGQSADDILSYLAAHAPDIYAATTYTVVELSSRLAATQMARFADGSGSPHAGKVEVVRASIADWAPEAGSPVAAAPHVYALAFEVLDNMPHDKVVVSDGAIHEVVVCEGTDRLVENLREVVDPDVIEFLDLFGVEAVADRRDGAGLAARTMAVIADALSGRSEGVFLPTTAMAMVRNLVRVLPSHTMLVSDFSYLPERIAGVNGPAVQSKHDGQTVMHGSYLTLPGHCDIMFPTDFDLLARMHSTYVARAADHRPAYDYTVVAQKEFMGAWADTAATATASGYNPMLEDFANVEILCAAAPATD